LILSEFEKSVLVKYFFLFT